jgi:photosystem II stability/assembly factor-like uncharacterized protein
MKNIFRFIRCIGFIIVVFCLFTTTDPLYAQWIQTNGPHTELTYTLAVAVNDAGDTVLFAGTNYGGVFLSMDYGDSWKEIDGGNISMGDTGFTQKDIRALAAIPNSTGGIDLFAGTEGHGIFFSANADTLWTPVNNGLTDKFVYVLIIRSDGKGDTNLYAGTGDSVFLSTDKGANWVPTNTELRGYDGYVIGRTETGDTILFKLDGSGSVLRSTDNGNQWNQVIGLPSYAWVTCLAVHDTIVYAGTSGYGVYYSHHNGEGWFGGGGLSVKTLEVGGSFLFAGVGSPFSITGSVWRRPLSEMLTGIKDMSEQNPSNFTLEQNYPNPFNPSTDIYFTIPSKGFVTLKVYDLLGREIATLVAGVASAGNHSVRWNASSFSSGIYFYRLQTEKYSETKKLVLIR